MFSYCVNCRVLPQPQPHSRNEETNTAIRITENYFTPLDISDGADRVRDGSPNQVQPLPAQVSQDQLTKYPLIWIPKAKKLAQQFKKDSAGIQPRRLEREIPPEDEVDSNFEITVRLDFGNWFTWLERGIWLTMIVSIIWALALDVRKATKEVCLRSGGEYYPFNFLPSLSRTMGSYRVGTLFWTICMASCFMGRMLSNYFLHKMYETWYEPNWFNIIFLKIAYCMDNLEIISLVMIPAYNLDCDPKAHRAAFIAFLVFTYLAETLQYLTRFLRRKKGILLMTADISKYYRQIGILIILQTFFLLWMLLGFLLHENICDDFHFTIFTLGEYFTIIVNVRFKRDTILFVR